MGNAACGPKENLYLHCELRDRSTEVSVCFDDDTAYYRYGNVDQQPELELFEPLVSLSYRPSTRDGQYVWDEVEFSNGQYRYKIYMGFLIPFEDVPKGEFSTARFMDALFGELTVLQNDDIIGELQCQYETINFQQRSMIEVMEIENVRLWTPWKPPI